MRTAHLRRWHVALAFGANVVAICVVAVILGRLINDNSSTIDELQRTKVNINSLQHTNCKLKGFITAAQKARAHAALEDKTAIQRQNDLEAAKVYKTLAQSFGRDAVGPACQIRG